MTAPSITVERQDTTTPPREVHLVRRPNTERALCGFPRGNRPLRHGDEAREATCVVCLGLAGLL